ncbi:MAG: hypothetical protein ACRELY_03105 [Polyangiaceae bacterium]
MKRIAALALLLACGKTQGATPVLDETLSFDGGFARDVVLQHGTKRWIVIAHCDRCNREYLGVDLRFDGNAPPPVEIWVDNPQGSRNKGSGCFETDMLRQADAGACTISVSHGSDGPAFGRYVVTVMNDGPPIAAHLSLAIIDPYE